MSDLKRLLERSLREKEPEDFVDLPAKVEEFIRENKIDETAGKQLRTADPKVQKEVIHRGGLLECKNPSAVCLARIREEKKLLGESSISSQGLQPQHLSTSIGNQSALVVAQQMQAQQMQAQQMMMANMGSQMMMVQAPALVGIPGLGGMVSTNCAVGLGGAPGLASIGTPGLVGAVAAPIVPTMGAFQGLVGPGSLTCMPGAVDIIGVPTAPDMGSMLPQASLMPLGLRGASSSVGSHSALEPSPMVPQGMCSTTANASAHASAGVGGCSGVVAAIGATTNPTMPGITELAAPSPAYGAANNSNIAQRGAPY